MVKGEREDGKSFVGFQYTMGKDYKAFSNDGKVSIPVLVVPE